MLLFFFSYQNIDIKFILWVPHSASDNTCFNITYKLTLVMIKVLFGDQFWLKFLCPSLSTFVYRLPLSRIVVCIFWYYFLFSITSGLMWYKRVCKLICYFWNINIVVYINRGVFNFHWTLHKKEDCAYIITVMWFYMWTVLLTLLWGLSQY